MNKRNHRLQRISSQLHKEIAKILIFNINDPRLNNNVTISGLNLSKDFCYAKVFVTYIKKDKISIKNNLFILNNSISYITKILRKKIKLRIMPKINFFYDDSIDIGNKISKLILENKNLLNY